MSHFFLNNNLFLFQFADAFFECGDHARHTDISNAVEQLIELLFNFGKLRGQRICARLTLRDSVIP
ncbi:hypothetical protein [Nitratireductor aquibiodomus]|uniref:hypothetical protein n=1 Tax=Nitratireductor aquibiodomus TaxID=204799 RepID=UPI000B87AAB5|nr:hypothetical protein [Nitratireductor aquibiodomus]